jgi:cell division septum initiation protein DivIVA
MWNYYHTESSELYLPPTTNHPLLESLRGKLMDKLDQAIAALKAENKRLEQELNRVRAAIAALQGAANNGRGIKPSSGRTISAAARRRIAAAQKARWAKWRAAQRKQAA